MAKLLGKDLKAYGLELNYASDDFDTFATADLNDTLTDVLPCITRRIYVGTAGDLSVLLRSGATKTITAIADGTVLELCVVKILATDTTADDITVFY
jgi:hypothetical protein